VSTFLAHLSFRPFTLVLLNAEIMFQVPLWCTVHQLDVRVVPFGWCGSGDSLGAFSIACGLSRMFSISGRLRAHPALVLSETKPHQFTCTIIPFSSLLEMLVEHSVGFVLPDRTSLAPEEEVLDCQSAGDSDCGSRHYLAARPAGRRTVATVPPSPLSMSSRPPCRWTIP